MAKRLVLAEKPSVARDLARVLGCAKKGDGYLEGTNDIVTWALGHLVTLADPEAYEDKYKTWRLEDLPMLPEKLQLTVIKQSGKQFAAVKSQLARSDVSEIIIATDAGREGELVARWILEKANVRKPVKRLWISSVTDKAIRDGFAKLRPGKEYEDLYAAAAARSEADWYVGLNASRALTTKFNAQLNCGRVQTPVVAIVAMREDEINHFQPRTYYGIEARTQDSLVLSWQDAGGNGRSFDAARVAHIVERIGGSGSAIVRRIERKAKKLPPPALYDLTELQRDGNKLFGYSAKETLGIVQKLYEQHKAVSYPRTDSRYLSSDMVGTIADRLRGCGVGPYRALAQKAAKTRVTAASAFIDDAKVSDHHALVPTEEPANLSAMNEKERKIYDLIVRRFIAVLLAPSEYEQVTLLADIGGETFRARGKTVLQAGWKEAYERFEEDGEDEEGLREQLLPRLAEGDKLPVRLIAQTSGQTSPPPRFTEATLLTAMENPAPFLGSADKRAAETLKATGGLGTVATRGDIIEKLFGSFLIEKRGGGKEIYLTSKGRQLLELVPADLKSPELTAEWEQKLERIAKGQLRKDDFVAEIKRYTKSAVAEIKASGKTYRHDNLTRTACPDCGKPMLEVNGKKGKMLVCQDRECGARKNVARVTNARCPQCRKKLELRGEGEGQIFVCVGAGCGYREKLSAFEARRKKESGGGKADKRAVQQFLQEQKREEAPVNTALADALKKMQFGKD